MTEPKRVFHPEIIPFPEGQERLKLMVKKTVTCKRSESTCFYISSAE